MAKVFLADNGSQKSSVKFQEVVTKPLPVASALILFVVTLFLSTASGSALANLGLSTLIENYRWAVGLCFVIALIWLAVTAFIWITRWIYREASVELNRLQTIRRERVRVEDEICKMTPQEREIIGCLLAKNQRTFTNAENGGLANGLVSRGLVVLAVRRGRLFSRSQVPFEVPQHVWRILVERKSQFPYVAPKGGREPHPWRI